MKLRTIIIDDEPNSLQLLAQMLENHCEGVEIIGRAASVNNGIEIIEDLNPDLVCLDIEMPGGGGFEILNAFKEISFQVIFVTGHKHYAIKAFRYAALDYLLKPVNLGELQEAIARARERVYSSGASISFLKDQLTKTTSDIEEIVISDKNKHVIAPIDDITYLEAHGNYISFHMQGGNKYTVIKSLSHYEDILPVHQFFRIHKSYLINLNYVQSYGSGRGGHVLLQGNVRLAIAQRRKPMFVKIAKKKWGRKKMS